MHFNDGIATSHRGILTQQFVRFAQILAGLGEVRRNNLFGYTAFCLYGGYWMSVATIEIVSLLADETPPTNKKALQGMLFMVSVFTYMLWTLTFKMNYTISSLFFLLGSTCMLLSFGTRDETVDKVGGWFGVATSINAFVSVLFTLFRNSGSTSSHLFDRHSGWHMRSL